MARGPEDILVLRLDLQAQVSLDMERIEQDPVFSSIFLLASSPEEALREYLSYYLDQESLFKRVPSTNGPGKMALQAWTLIGE